MLEPENNDSSGDFTKKEWIEFFIEDIIETWPAYSDKVADVLLDESLDEIGKYNVLSDLHDDMLVISAPGEDAISEWPQGLSTINAYPLRSNNEYKPGNILQMYVGAGFIISAVRKIVKDKIGNPFSSRYYAGK